MLAVVEYQIKHSMNLKVCGIGHPLGLFFGVFQLLLFFVKNNVARLTVASQQPLSRGAGGGGERGVGETLIENLLAG